MAAEGRSGVGGAMGPAAAANSLDDKSKSADGQAFLTAIAAKL